MDADALARIDYTEITDDWLEHQGFEDRALRLDHDFTLHALTGKWWEIRTKDTSDGYYGCLHELTIPAPYNRGEARRLLYALGVGR